MRVGLLIDGENVSAHYLPAILQHASSLGSVAVRQVFADFSQPARQKWQQACKQFGLRARHQPSLGKGKNSADIAVAVEAMALVGDNRIDGICLASNDRDFVPLALHLRERGIAIHACGLAVADGCWRAACDSFHILTPLPPVHMADSRVATTGLSREQALVIARIIREACEESAAGNGEPWLPLSKAAAALRAKAPELAETLCVKGKFRKNLGAMALFEEADLGGAIRIRPRHRIAGPT